MCSGKLRTYDTVQVVGRYEPDSFTNTPHFEAYKRLVEGFRADPPPLYLNASGSKSSEPTRGAISTLLEDLYMKPQTCCQCESVHAAVPAVAENPLELRRLLPAPGVLCATGSEIPATVPKLAFPRALLPSRESMHPSWSSRATLPSTGELPGWRDLCCVRASMWPRCANIPKSTPSTGLEISAIAAAGACVIIPDVIPLNPPPWVRAVSEIPSTEQSCLAWKGAEKTIGRGSISLEAGFHLHAISRESGSHPHAISREAGARMLSACWHIAVGTPSE